MSACPAHRPLRIAHLADTHLGYSAYGKTDLESGRNQRAVDIEQSFAAAIDSILTQDVDLVLHAGDVFHHTRPSWTTLSHFVRQMRRLERAGIPAVVIAGNHDTPRLRSTGSVYGLLGLALPETRFHFGYEPGEERFEELGLLVHCVPHGALTNPDPPFLLAESGMRNVVVAHGRVAGYSKPDRREPGEEELRGNILDTGFDYIALGHEHLRGQAALNAWFSGSTERTSWGDQAATPGYAVVTLEGRTPRVEFVDVLARPMLTLTPAIDGEGREARDLAETILRRAAALEQPEAMVRVELRNTPRPLFRETEAIVRRETADAAWLIRLMTPGEVDGPNDLPRISGLAELNPLTLFKSFVSEREAGGIYDPEFASRFRTRGEAVLEAAFHRAQEADAAEGDPR